MPLHIETICPVGMHKMPDTGASVASENRDHATGMCKLLLRNAFSGFSFGGRESIGACMFEPFIVSC